MKNIAVQGCTLEISPASTPPCVITIKSAPSQKTKADGKYCYRGDIDISVSGYTGGTITVAGSGSGSDTISGSSTKTQIDGMAAVLEGDKVSFSLDGKAVSGSSTIDVKQLVTVKISSAGQSKAQTE